MATIEKIEEKLKIAEEKLENAKKKSEKLKEEGNMKLDELKVKLSGKKLANDEKAMWEVEKKSLEKQEEDLKANMNVWKEDAEKQGEALQKKLDKEVGNEQIAYGMDNSNRQNLQGPNTRDRWVPPTHVTRTIPKVIEDQMSIDVVQHKVTALLNKLTLEKFDVISDQIIEYANKSKFEKDCCILKEVLRLIQLTFEKLCHECDKINFGQMHAQLCKRMMEMIDPEVTDENVKNNDGELVSGGTLFRKFLLKHCQEDFEKVSKVNIPIPSNEKGELDLLSDEYYYSTKAKRSRLGLMCFLGELFKLGMFTERAMHECILSQIQNANEVPGEEAIENLCKLLTTVGKQLDHGHDKAKNPMDVYFNRMDEMSKNKAFSSRIRFMLQDVIDLRNYKWIPRHDNNAPKTISEVHEDAAKQKSSGGRGMLKMTERISHGGFPHHNFIQPLEQTKDRWVPPTHVTRTIPKVIKGQVSIDVVQRKVTALLNKLTLEKFDVISDQIIEYANKSKFEKDCCIFKEVLRLIQLTFEKLCHECDKINFGQMHAQLCRKMMEMIDPEVTDENVKNNDGEVVSGGTLFRKFLLKHCQEDFEKVSKVNIPIPSNEKGELDLLSDEYYYSTKAKRSRLGLMCFLGELFKLGMFTERAMHECILSQIQNANEVPGEEAIENLCKLLTTVGKQLDHGHDKAKNPMDVYFNRMDEMSKNKAFSSRIRFMLQDVIDLRNYKWIPRHDNNAPKTISEVHEDAAKQKSSGGRGMLKMTERISHGGFPHHNFIQPLEQTKDRWVPPTHVTRTIPKVIKGQVSIDVVQRKVTALLNKLTLEKFDVISDQIIEYANKSKFEKDCCIFKEVLRLIQLTFEKLCHECDKINFGQMHAQLCRKMMEMIDPEVTDENVKNNDGELVSGGTLFRKFLLKHCQEDFEKVLKVNIPVPSNEKGELDLLSDEYYHSTKAKRSRLGLMCFIGELFKLNMLTERIIISDCIRRLLQVQSANEVPGEEAIENLCKLLTTVGRKILWMRTLIV
ncbi:776_t:CDS:2 [Entrophospora sp. SA101]|nr:776_t:CDS:2 [Entrophospora sp. SA101]